MGLEISVEERPVTHYVGITLSARLAEFGAPDGPNAMIPRVYEWLAERAIIPLGGPLYVYRRIGAPGEPVDLTVAVPIAQPIEPSSGLVLGSLPAGTYVTGRFTGHPDGIAAAQRQVMDWAATHQHSLDTLPDDGGAVWAARAEHFLTNPEEEPDPSKWVTELLFLTA